MQWKPVKAFSGDAEIPNWIGYPLIVITFPFWGSLVVAVWLGLAKRKFMGPSNEWRSWFAWFPVTIEFDEDGDWLFREEHRRVWLEWIERRTGYHHHDDVIFRATPVASSGPNLADANTKNPLP